eukprot:362478-Chlamydomonas_euryale.AAC.10
MERGTCGQKVGLAIEEGVGGGTCRRPEGLAIVEVGNQGRIVHLKGAWEGSEEAGREGGPGQILSLRGCAVPRRGTLRLTDARTPGGRDRAPT